MNLHRFEHGVLFELTTAETLTGFIPALHCRRVAPDAAPFTLPLALASSGKVMYRYTETADYAAGKFDTAGRYVLEVIASAAPSAGFPEGRRFVSEPFYLDLYEPRAFSTSV